MLHFREDLGVDIVLVRHRERLEGVRQEIQRLEQRRAERNAHVASESNLSSDDPDVLALAWVKPTANTDHQARRQAARAAVRPMLEQMGRVDEPLPLAGYDFMVTPAPLSEQPLFIVASASSTTAPSKLNPAEQMVAANVGDNFYQGLVAEDGTVEWAEGRSPITADTDESRRRA